MTTRDGTKDEAACGATPAGRFSFAPCAVCYVVELLGGVMRQQAESGPRAYWFCRCKSSENFEPYRPIKMPRRFTESHRVAVRRMDASTLILRDSVPFLHF